MDTKDSTEKMKDKLDWVNMWIGNCDQKASFLLALLGVAATVVCTSDLFIKIKEVLITPLKIFCQTGEGSFDFLRTLLALCLIASFVAILIALILLIFCLKANIDPKKFHQDGMTERSRIFFVSIAKMPYNDFIAASKEEERDLSTQVYINSAICTKKFNYYNKAIVWVLVAIPTFLLSVIILLFV